MLAMVNGIRGDTPGGKLVDVVAGSSADFAAFLKKDRQDASALVNKYMKQ